MARRIEIILIDDLDGKEIASGGQTVTFSYQGKEYTLDLSTKNAEKLDRALAPFVSVARRTGGRPPKRRSAARPRRTAAASGTAASKPADNRSIREWARSQGYAVSDRGRVSRSVLEAYAAA